jgi:hypothetical protein
MVAVSSKRRQCGHYKRQKKVATTTKPQALTLVKLFHRHERSTKVAMPTIHAAISHGDHVGNKTALVVDNNIGNCLDLEYHPTRLLSFQYSIDATPLECMKIGNDANEDWENMLFSTGKRSFCE